MSNLINFPLTRIESGPETKTWFEMASTPFKTTIWLIGGMVLISHTQIDNNSFYYVYDNDTNLFYLEAESEVDDEHIIETHKEVMSMLCKSYGINDTAKQLFCA